MPVDPTAIIVLGFLALFFGWMLLNHRQAQKTVGASASSLEPVFPGISRQERALVFCYSPNCPPCKTMQPAIRELAANHDNVYELNLATHPTAARTMGIRATPTLLVVIQGQVAEVLVGAKTPAFLRKLQDSH